MNHQGNKNPIAALLLGVIPGAAWLYLQKYVRAVLYAMVFFGLIGLFVLWYIFRGGRDDEVLGVIFFTGVFVWVINGIDLIVALLTGNYARNNAGYMPQEITEQGGNTSSYAAGAGQRPGAIAPRGTTVLLLSLVPGLGHFHMGLVQRGLAFLVSFFGMFTVIIFVTMLTNYDTFLVFLGVLPIIWIYNIADAVKQDQRIARGEKPEDRTIFEEWDAGRQVGKKSKLVATLLSLFPGAGHMYLGLQRRGIQLMAAFLFSIYIMDTLRLTLFLFIIPILWFYGFFDTLQKASRMEREEVQDEPFIGWLVNHQRWVGFALLALGAYYLLNDVFMEALQQILPELRVRFWFDRYFQTFVVSVLLIGGGLKLLLGNRRKGDGR
ncbi:hypothetical protein [Paenibacillus sp. y28]|uniref:hypothetical protein n=1 Tax=Paenibacillus sp. y28 TaxID=3129110 RepID=UPI00301AA17F